MRIKRMRIHHRNNVQLMHSICSSTRFYTQVYPLPVPVSCSCSCIAYLDLKASGLHTRINDVHCTREVWFKGHHWRCRPSRDTKPSYSFFFCTLSTTVPFHQKERSRPSMISTLPLLSVALAHVAQAWPTTYDTPQTPISAKDHTQGYAFDPLLHLPGISPYVQYR